MGRECDKVLDDKERTEILKLKALGKCLLRKPKRRRKD
jgi:hypothetical protein